MVKTFWTRFLGLILLILTLPIHQAGAQSYSDFYGQISDARSALQAGQPSQALLLLEELGSQFRALPESHSQAGQAVTQSLELVTADQALTEEELTSLTKALLAFEKEQHPVDEAAEKAKFEAKVFAALERLRQTLSQGEDREAWRTAFLAFNSVWTRHEGVVRPSIGHYGRIETGLSFLRASIEADPLDQTQVLSQLDEVDQALRAFVTGQDLEASSAISSLKEGISVLKQAQVAFEAGQASQGQGLMRDFISAWPAFEQVVSTRNGGLYRQVESQAPIIMVRGTEATYQEDLRQLISQLEALDVSQSYGILDSMVILLREGVEALVLVLSLVGILRATGQKKGLFWVYGGAGLGVVASGVAALVLHQFFPLLTSGVHREIMEGLVGLVAVVMLLGIGIWMHRKSQTKAWQAYLEQEMARVLSTGSFFSMFALAFLAVFREGAETIIFYVGILPHISWQAFWAGIGLALGLLCLLAWLFLRLAGRLPLHRIFRVLGWLIYLLACKMLGVSLHTLQLTNTLSSTHLTWLPSLPDIGLYPSVEVLVPQLGLLVVIWLGAWWSRRWSHE